MANLKLVVPTIAAITGLSTVGVAGIANADTTSQATGTSSTSQSSKPPRGGNGPQQKDGGVIVTDDAVNTSIKEALEAKYSDVTVDRVAKLPDGSYLAFTVQSGNKVIVSLDSSFAVTATKDVPAMANVSGAPGHQQGSSSSDTSTSS
jgi:hypothetical protein